MKKILFLILAINIFLSAEQPISTKDAKAFKSFRDKQIGQNKQVDEFEAPEQFVIQAPEDENLSEKDLYFFKQQLDYEEFLRDRDKKQKSIPKNPFSFVVNNKLLRDMKKYKTENNESENLERISKKFLESKTQLNPSLLPTPKDYKIQVGDSIKIDIYVNEIYYDYKVDVDKNGYIQVPSIGSIQIANLVFQKAKQKVSKKIQVGYPNSEIVFDVDQFSSISVTVSGNSMKPGAYNLPAFSSVKDLLILSNGVNKVGSVRNIIIKRENQNIKVDLYNLFFGKTNDKYTLKNHDQVIIPKANKLISASGKIGNPGIYELKQNETFKNLLNFSSGLMFNANKNSVKLTRFTNNKYIKVLTLRLKDLFKEIPQDGDNLEVFEISKINTNSINLFGNIIREGEYEVPQDKTLNTLIKNELDKGEFFLPNTANLVSIKSVSLKNTNNIRTLNIDDILNNKQQINIKEKDEIYFFNKLQLKENPYIYTSGVVLKNNSKYQFNKGMKVKDLFDIVSFNHEIYIKKDLVGVGKYDKCDSPRPQFSPQCKRIILKPDDTLQILRITPTGMKTFNLHRFKDAEFELQAFDEIKFFDYYQNNDKFSVQVFGEVNRPGEYHINHEIDMDDIINMAGGITKKAFTDNVEIIRYNTVNNQRIKKVINVNLVNDINFTIQNDDEIFIRSIPKWKDKKYITLKGEFKFPGVYAIEDGERLENVIKRAGGFSDIAFLNGAVFTRTAIQALQQKELDKSLRELKTKAALLSAQDDGSEGNGGDKGALLKSIDELVKEAKTKEMLGRLSLNIPQNIDDIAKSSANIVIEGGDTLFIPTINSTVTVVGEVLNPSSFVYEKGLYLRDYITKAGGFKNSADDESVFVIKANGEARKIDNGFFTNDNPSIALGETIVIPRKLEIKSDLAIFKDITDITYKLAVTIASLSTVGAI